MNFAGIQGPAKPSESGPNRLPLRDVRRPCLQAPGSDGKRMPPFMQVEDCTLARHGEEWSLTGRTLAMIT